MSVCVCVWAMLPDSNKMMMMIVAYRSTNYYTANPPHRYPPMPPLLLSLHL